VDGVARAQDVFDSLSQGGEIHVPFAKTFWSPGFGVLVDRYHIPWEINSSEGQGVA
jgi:PhnB protein